VGNDVRMNVIVLRRCEVLNPDWYQLPNLPGFGRWRVLVDHHLERESA